MDFKGGALSPLLTLRPPQPLFQNNMPILRGDIATLRPAHDALELLLLQNHEGFLYEVVD